MALIIFVWTRRLTAQPAWAFVVALMAVFSTILWPYAYIGLEDTQSFFLLLSSYLAFECTPARTWPGTILFAFSSALAICCKSTGAFLIPAVGFLIWMAFLRRGGRHGPRLAFLLVVVVTVFGASAYSRSFFWKTFGSSGNFLRFWLIPDPIYFLANLFSFFFSTNKGFFFYCPLLLVAAVCLPKLWRTQRNLVIFSGGACWWVFSSAGLE